MTSTRVGGAIFLIVSCLYGWFASDIPLDFFSRQETFNARSLPLIIAGAGVICSIMMIALPSTPTDWQRLRALHWRQPLILLALMWLYAWSFEFLGFAIATAAFLALAVATLGERKPLRMAAVIVPLVAGFWLLMEGLGIYLEPGRPLRWLMTLAGID